MGMLRKRRRTGLVTGLVSAALLVTSCTLPGAKPTNPPIDSHGVIASAKPHVNTPDFNNGAVTAIAQVGGRVVVGGSFTSVTSKPTQGAGVTRTRNFLMAYRLDNYQIDTGFAPVVDGEVDAIEANANHSAVYVAGKFKHSGGNTSRITHVALFNIINGQPSHVFNANVSGGNVNAMQLVGNHLLIGGYFTSVGGVSRAGLASLNATTGALEPYFAISLLDHFNYGRPNGTFSSPVGATSLAVSPDGRRAIVGGNFRRVSDPVQKKIFAHDQLVSINLNAASATVDAGWSTTAYSSRCFSTSFDGYLNDIAWAPNGSFFVVTATGGYSGGSFQNCDTASRFNASSRGLRVNPAWVQYTGTDSLYAVAVTSSAVYVGGHNRWLNNPYGQDAPESGAVPRPGIAALDPVNGVPLSWNPGHNPRGHGVTVMYVSPTGLYIGSDQDFIGYFQYERKKFAFFPFVGGSAPAPNQAGTSTRIFHGGSFLSGTNALGASAFNASRGTGFGTKAPASNIAWSEVRGAFTLNNRIYYGKSDGSFYVRGFDGKTFGATEFRIDPYHDPYWDGKPTGSGQTYDGNPSSFYAEIPNISGMFYANRSIYYTVVGDTRLFRRDFTPGTERSTIDPSQFTGGVIGARRLQVVQNGGIVNMSKAGGMFVAAGSLWYASQDTGRLYRAPWNGRTVTGRATPVPGATGTWSGRAVFLAP